MDCTILPMVPVLQEKIWGGDKLKAMFAYDIPSPRTGECWGIGAHKNGDCTVADGPFRGKKLSELWTSHRELFGNSREPSFPLLVKIIDAKDDLSIQVHPDDAYAALHENGERGKTECWYILDAEPDATIIIGHNAATKAEMAELVRTNRWKELLREIPVKRGDFFQIDPGCIHAIKRGTVLLETQQSSDTTYRFYDYGRLQDGKPRPLHIAQSIDVATAPFVPSEYEKKVREQAGCTMTELVSCPYYTVFHCALNGAAVLPAPTQFENLSVISGECTVNGTAAKAGSHLVACGDGDSLRIEGNAELILSVPSQT